MEAEKEQDEPDISCMSEREESFKGDHVRRKVSLKEVPAGPVWDNWSVQCTHAIECNIDKNTDDKLKKKELFFAKECQLMYVEGMTEIRVL